MNTHTEAISDKRVIFLPQETLSAMHKCYTISCRLLRIHLGANSFSRQSVPQSVIHSVTLFKQSASLSKHFNPPTSSLFPWTLAAVCHGTSGSSPGARSRARLTGGVSALFSQALATNIPFLHIQMGTLIQ